MSAPAAVLGLDIGGANLKAAHIGGTAASRPFALWQQPERLTAELQSLCAALPAYERLAITMTGELCDCFPSKQHGVRAIVQSVVQAAAGKPVDVWTIHGRLVEPAVIELEPLPAAAANWLALAHFVARSSAGQPTLLVDTGSTTTDIVYLDQGQAWPRGLTDTQRLASGELVYSAVRRTPVCAVLGLGVAAEWFATMLDVYLWLGHWPELPHDNDTADRRPATRRHAQARLARLLCADTADLPESELDALAQRALDAQLGWVGSAVDRVLAGRPAVERVFVAGSGDVLGRLLHARHPQLRGRPLQALAETLGPALSEAACAYAVAMLAAAARTGA